MDLSMKSHHKFRDLDKYKMKETTMICIKYLLFLLNLIISMFGSIIIIAGIVIQVAWRQYLDFYDHSIFSIPVFLFSLGLIITIISFCGCCGSINEHHGLTTSYSWVLGSLFVIELLLGITIFNLHNQVGMFFESSMEAAMKNFHRQGYKGVTETWNVLQHELSCCGAESYLDWENTTFAMSSLSVPDSCCVKDIKNCGQGILGINPHEAALKINSVGCLSVISQHMKENVTTLVAIVVGTLFVQFVGLVFSFCLANSIKKECEIV